MKKVTSTDSIITINHYKNLLTSEGISAFIRNEYLGSIVGEMPFPEAWPQLWVENDLDYDRALQLIDERNILDESPAAAWRCKYCDSDNEGQFSACWNCSKVHL
jgi:hypothetical protein